MSLADNPAAVDAAIKAQSDAASKYTLMDIRQGPGEGNFDRVQRLTVEDMLRAAEAAALPEKCRRCRGVGKCLEHHDAPLVGAAYGTCSRCGGSGNEPLDEQDTLVLKTPPPSEGEANESL